jgi:hypothetical protein
LGGGGKNKTENKAQYLIIYVEIRLTTFKDFLKGMIFDDVIIVTNNRTGAYKNVLSVRTAIILPKFM